MSNWEVGTQISYSTYSTYNKSQTDKKKEKNFYSFCGENNHLG